jgi:hypothetical protein
MGAIPSVVFPKNVLKKQRSQQSLGSCGSRSLPSAQAAKHCGLWRMIACIKCLFAQIFLCLSKACLGKLIVFTSM